MGYLDKFRFCPVCGSSGFSDHDFKSRVCPACGFVFYYNAAAACAAIITNERGEMLVGIRGDEPCKGTLDLIGGFVDPGESAEEAIVREVGEETGIDLKKLSDEGLCSIEYMRSYDSTYVYSGFEIRTCDSMFKITIPSSVELKASDDVASCFWMPTEEVDPSRFGLKSIRQTVNDYLNAI